MKQKFKKVWACVLTLCMLLGMVKIPAVTGKAAEIVAANHVANPEGGSTGTGMEATTGAVNMTWRLKEDASGEVSLLKLGNNTEFCVDTASGEVIVKAGAASYEAAVANTALDTEKWHNIAVNVSNSQVVIYVDGVEAGSTAWTGGIDASAVTYGEDVYISSVDYFDALLGEAQIETLHEQTASANYPDATEKLEGYEKSANIGIFNAGYGGSTAYRIPAIVTSEKTGTVFASIDKRWNGSGDIGIIDSVIRRSEDNGATWGETIPVIALEGSCGYTVDPALLVDNDENSEHYGRVYMLVDMWQNGTGFWGAQEGTGYIEVDGVDYLKLTDADGAVYTVRENGVVYDSNNQVTAYQVETEAVQPFTTQGNLYKDGELVGNIYKNSELVFTNTCYLWLTYSDDDGITWCTPKDITPMVKSDWMHFCGTGPGMGVQTQSGRLIFPTYATSDDTGSTIQSSFNVYSDDGGETWHQGGSPNNGGNMQTATGHLTESCIIELNNGHLIQFMRSYAGKVSSSISTDGGVTWGAVTRNDIVDPYCQMSAVHYPTLVVDPRDGQEKEAIIFSNPSPVAGSYSDNGRHHGRVRIAFVNEDDTLDWAYSKMIEEGKYLYSSLTVMNNGNIGLIYENEKSITAASFTSFSLAYLMDENAYENTPTPTAIRTEALTASGAAAEVLEAGCKVMIEVDFDNYVFAAGNVTLNVEVGEEIKEAELVGNVDEDTLAFCYTIADTDSGTVTATAEVNVKEGGVAETVYNVSLTAYPMVTKTSKVGTIAAAAGAFGELPTTGMTATAGSAYGGTTEGPASNVLDGNLTTHWHSNYPTDNVSNGGRSKHWIDIDLGGTRLVTGLTYTPRSGVLNGTITEYQIEISTDGQNYVSVATGTWAKTADVKQADFGGAVLASHVRLRALETGDEWATAGEIRILGTTDTSASEDKTALLSALADTAVFGDDLSLIDEGGALEAAIEAAKQTAADTDATAAEVNAAISSLTEVIAQVSGGLKDKLAEEIAKAEAKEQSDYNISTWAAYAAALNTAKAITDNSDDKEVIAAYSNLRAAEQSLALSSAGKEKEAAAKAEALSAAQTVPAAAEEMVAAGQRDFTDASWAEFISANEALAAAVESKTVSADELKALTAALAAAQNNLAENVPAVSEETAKAAEAAMIAAKAAVEKGQGDYTDASWTAFVNAYNALGSAMTEGSEEKIKAATAALVSAQKALAVKAQATITKGSVYEVSTLKYKVTDAEKAEVMLVGTTNKKRTALKIAKEVTINGVKCKVTAVGAKAFKNCKKLKSVVIGANVKTIGKQAFAGCAKLKKITVKSKVLTKVGAKALKGIDKKAVIKVPKAKKAAYKRVFAKKGQAKTVKIK